MEKLGNIKETLSTEGWTAIKASLKDKQEKAMRQLADVRRPPVPSDEALRGLISGLDWVIQLDERVTRILESEKTDRELQAAEERGIGSPMEPEEEPTE